MSKGICVSLQSRTKALSFVEHISNSLHYTATVFEPVTVDNKVFYSHWFEHAEYDVKMFFYC